MVGSIVKPVFQSLEDKAGLRIHLAMYVCNLFLNTPIPFEKFGEPSKQYMKLRSRIIDNKNNMLISQDGKLARLYAEFASDDIPLICSAISRLWRR